MEKSLYHRHEFIMAVERKMVIKRSRVGGKLLKMFDREI